MLSECGTGVAAAGAPSRRQTHVAREPNVAKRGCILIVEDDDISRRMLVKLFGRLGFDASGAATIQEGLAHLEGKSCLILDLNLPDGLGTAVLQKVRSENRPIRVAVFTGSTDAELLGEAKRHRPDGFFNKPINLNELIAWVEGAGGVAA